MVGGAGIVRMGVQEDWPLTSWPYPFHPIQSYCLKVKEMDDEEYSCIVSTEGAQAGIGRAWGAHTAPSEGSRSAKSIECVGHPGVLVPRVWGYQPILPALLAWSTS